MKEKRDMNIELDPDIAAAFQASSSVSRKKLYIHIFRYINPHRIYSVKRNWCQYAQEREQEEENQSWNRGGEIRRGIKKTKDGIRYGGAHQFESTNARGITNCYEQ